MDVHANRSNMRETTYRTYLDDYAEKWRDMIVFRREDGILEVRFHTDGGSFLWGVDVHKNLVPAFHDIACDPENECLIITGTGDSFLADRDEVSWERAGYRADDQRSGAIHTYDHWYLNQTREPFSFLHMPIPSVAALNGPHHFHVEISLLADIVIAVEHTWFHDGHTGVGIVPGDGGHILWPRLLGPNRGRAFLWTGERLYADEAQRLGVIHEVVPVEQLNARAWELARTVFMSQPRVTRRMTHALLMQPWREAFEREIFAGLAHEAYAASEGRGRVSSS
jgi:enoyl-CoA hydratase/carnithine racemase